MEEFLHPFLHSVSDVVLLRRYVAVNLNYLLRQDFVPHRTRRTGVNRDSLVAAY